MQSASLPCSPTRHGQSPFTAVAHKAEVRTTLLFLFQDAENPRVCVCVYSHTENTSNLSGQLDELSQNEHIYVTTTLFMK